MSTRCQIGFYPTLDEPLEDYDALLYRHWDGYPDEESGVVEDIMPFLRRFDKERGLEDAEYAAARTLQYLCNKDDTEDEESLTGYGISNNFHADINYYYAVRPDRLEIYKTDLSANPSNWDFVGQVLID